MSRWTDARPGPARVRQAYRAFAEREAHGVSPVYEDWALGVADDDAVADLLMTLPSGKRQPNLVFAAARWHGARGGYDTFRSTLLERWPDVRATILARATQTNEAGRCAVLLPFLAELPQPLALLEVGASAGLCLLPDRYSYRYDDGTALDPVSGPADVLLPCALGPGVAAPLACPRSCGVPVSTSHPSTCPTTTPARGSRPSSGPSTTSAAPGCGPRWVSRAATRRASCGVTCSRSSALWRPRLRATRRWSSSTAPSSRTSTRTRGPPSWTWSRTLPGHWISNEGAGVLHRARPRRGRARLRRHGRRGASRPGRRPRALDERRMKHDLERFTPCR